MWFLKTMKKILKTNFRMITLEGKKGYDQGEAFRGLQRILGSILFL